MLSPHFIESYTPKMHDNEMDGHLCHRVFFWIIQIIGR